MDLIKIISQNFCFVLTSLYSSTGNVFFQTQQTSIHFFALGIVWSIDVYA